MAKKGPKHENTMRRDPKKKPFGARPDKAELLARMKKGRRGKEGLRSQPLFHENRTGDLWIVAERSARREPMPCVKPVCCMQDVAGFQFQ